MAPQTQPSALPPEALLEPLPPPLVELSNRLRAIVRRTVPDAVERVREGQGIIGLDLPVERREVYFAWIWPQPGDFHVHIGFVHGVLLDDRNGELEGRGVTKRARWLTFVPGDEIDERTVERWLRAAAALAGLPPAVRAGLLREVG
ncbi:MAG: DUF1801 domain-containing protein [Chloroflexi bacterium]|nr:DUF1801 domain-containing protein [Chloroflexota bacterium]